MMRGMQLNTILILISVPDTEAAESVVNAMRQAHPDEIVRVTPQIPVDAAKPIIDVFGDLCGELEESEE